MASADWLGPVQVDVACFALSALALVLYHLYLRRRLKRDPAYTVQAVNTLARTAWVENVMGGGKDILAVQTLRNSTMAATFLASTAVLLVMGTLTLSGQGVQLETSWHALNTVGAVHSEVWIFKLLLLLLDFFVAFFSFTSAVRLFNHVGYMINVPLSLQHKAISPERVAVHLNRAGNYYSIGMRAYYFAVPLVFWLFGPVFMLVATLALIVVLYLHDRAPSDMAEDYR
jgi:uncharacterized membrane protein